MTDEEIIREFVKSRELSSAETVSDFKHDRWFGKDCMELMSKARQEGVKDFITKMYGKRCPDYEENCGCCEMWKLYDEWRTDK